MFNRLIDRDEKACRERKRVDFSSMNGNYTHNFFYIFTSFLVLFFIALIDRSYLIDNQNYINYFEFGEIKYWIEIFTPKNGLTLSYFASLFSEELLWRVWTACLQFLSAEYAVISTVVILNCIIFVSFARFKYPFIAMILWILIPTALPVIGLYQFRQGFAFAIFMILFSFQRGTFGIILAALIHITFLPIMVFFSSMRVLKLRYWPAVAVVSGLALSGAAFGGILFDLYGGRRLDTYRIDEGATSIFYFFVSSFLGFTYLLAAKFTKSNRFLSEADLSYLFLTAYGICFFSSLSFWIFPLGTSRLGYFIFIFLIPLLSNLNFNKNTKSNAWYAIFIICVFVNILYLLYLISEEILIGRLYCITLRCI